MAQPPVRKGVAEVSAALLALLAALFGRHRGVDVYAAFVEGAKDGLRTAAQTAPCLCAALLLLAFVRGSGVLEGLEGALRPLFSRLGLEEALLPFLLLRPVSGSASLAALQGLIDRFGPDGATARMAAALFASSETTLYVASLYLGAAGRKNSRYILPVAFFAWACGAAVTLFALELF